MLDEVHMSHTRDKVKPTIAVRCNGDEDKKSKAERMTGQKVECKRAGWSRATHRNKGVHKCIGSITD